MDKIIGKQLPKKDQDNEHWVSMSDLMAGLMMVFDLFGYWAGLFM